MTIKKWFLTLILSALFCTRIFAQNWVPQTSGTIQNLNSIYGTSATNAFIVGNNGIGRKTSDGGSNWLNMSLGSSFSHYSLRFLNSTIGFTVGDNQEILKTTTSGSSWTSLGIGITALYDGFFLSSTSGWVVGDIEVGYGFLYNQFTLNLIQIPAIANKVLRGIYFANSTTGWVVGDGGLIIKTINGGTAWTQQTSSTINQLNKVMFTDANNGIAVGNSGTILKKTDGSTWLPVTTSFTQNLNSVYYGSASEVWICGDQGLILHSINGGNNWSQEVTNITENLNAIHGFGITDIWSCGNNGKIIYRSGTTSVFDLQLTTNISIYPNPCTGKFSVNSNSDIKSIEIYDVFGKKVYATSKFNLQTSNEIDLSDFPKGIYFVKIYDELKNYTQKIVMQ